MGFTKKRTKIESKVPKAKASTPPTVAPTPQGEAPSSDAGSETPMLDAVAQQDSAPPSEGSSLVVNASAANEPAADGQSYTQDLLARQRDNPDTDIDDLAKSGSDNDSLHSHADHAATGSKKVAEDGKKAAVYVGNSEYRRVPKLEGAKRDAGAMHSTWSGKGFAGTLAEDQTGAGISKTFQSVTGGLGEGDRALVYYAGHGVSAGLVGVAHDPNRAGSDIAPHALIQGLVQQAEARGFHLTAILDACQSGAASAKVTEDRLAELDSPAESEIVRNLAKVGKLVIRGRRQVESASEAEAESGGRGFEKSGGKRGLAKGASTAPLRKAHGTLAKAVEHYGSFTDGDGALDGILPDAQSFATGSVAAALDVVNQLSRGVIARIEVHRKDPI